MFRPAVPVLALVATLPVLGKIRAPEPVPPVRAQGVEYTAPHGAFMGFVAAHDLKTGILLWRRQIYTVRFDPRLETDVQCSFITGLALEGGKLRVANDRGFTYELDLATLEVKAGAGLVVERRAE